jgi:hypothetical protein
LVFSFWSSFEISRSSASQGSISILPSAEGLSIVVFMDAHYFAHALQAVLAATIIIFTTFSCLNVMIIGQLCSWRMNVILLHKWKLNKHFKKE